MLFVLQDKLWVRRGIEGSRLEVVVHMMMFEGFCPQQELKPACSRSITDDFL